MKTLLGIAAVVAAAVITPIAPAHASTDCGYVRTGVRVVALTENTSCDFAFAVANAMMNGGGNPLRAYSPVTGQWYSMHCMIEQHGSTTCRGGDNAAVQIF